MSEQQQGSTSKFWQSPSKTQNRLLLSILGVVFIAMIGLNIKWLYTLDWLGFGEGQSTSVTVHTRDTNGNIIETVTTKSDPAKTLWDWLSLLGVPLSLALLGSWFQISQQRQAEEATKERREQTELATKEEVLQAYFDRISVLLVDKNLLGMAAQKKGRPGYGSPLSLAEKEILDAAIDVIRARTLSLLRRFGDDGERKSSVVRFLVETEVLSKLNIRLSTANLSHTELRGINLANVNLVNSNLSYADLSYADLSRADMRGANLRGTKLVHSRIEGCDFLGATLTETDFNNAIYDQHTKVENRGLLLSHVAERTSTEKSTPKLTTKK